MNAWRRVGHAAVILCAALSSATAWADGGQHKSQLVSIKTRPGVTQDFLLVQPAAEPPIASVVLFSGGEGNLALRNRGPGWMGGNFLVRSRYFFADQGFLVAVPDTPSDHAGGYGKSFRGSDDHAADIAAVIAHMRQQASVPVWLVGTSMGTISATKGALLKEGGPDGLVLTSSIARSTPGTLMTVLNFSLQNIHVPTLILSHREDSCSVTPAGASADIQRRLTAAPKVAIKIMEGGATPQGDPCEAFSHHGFIGIERETVDVIADWIKSAARP